MDIISQENPHQIRSIHVSDDDETPSQINYYFSHYFHLNDQFIHLKSLSLTSIYSEQLLIDITNKLHQLHYLTYLKIDQCRIDHDIINRNYSAIV